MAYTSHGHHIPDTVKTSPEPEYRARCGGTLMCSKCKAESAAFHSVDGVDFQTKAKHMVLAWVEANPLAGHGDFDVYVSWFSKTLQNWKVLLGTTRPDGLYFEVTYDGNYKRAYLDVYRKVENITIPD